MLHSADRRRGFSLLELLVVISILALLQFFALGASVGSRFGRALPPHVP